MVALAPVLWLAVFAASQESCRDQWQDEFTERAGISHAEWNRMCDEGKEDPKAFYTDRYLKKEAHDGKVDHDRAIANQFLNMKFLQPEERQALLDVDPENLEPAQRAAYAKWKAEALGLPPDDGKEAPPVGLDCSQPDKNQTLAMRALKANEWKEMDWKQCRWLRNVVECDLSEIEPRFMFRAFYDCGSWHYRCFNRDDMIGLWLGFYKGGLGTRADIEGQVIMGIPANKLPSCRRRLWLNEYPIRESSDR
jgi:hypothetical protein